MFLLKLTRLPQINLCHSIDMKEICIEVVQPEKIIWLIEYPTTESQILRRKFNEIWVFDIKTSLPEKFSTFRQYSHLLLDRFLLYLTNIEDRIRHVEIVWPFSFQPFFYLLWLNPSRMIFIAEFI